MHPRVAYPFLLLFTLLEILRMPQLPHGELVEPGSLISTTSHVPMNLGIGVGLESRGSPAWLECYEAVRYCGFLCLRYLAVNLRDNFIHSSATYIRSIVS